MKRVWLVVGHWPGGKREVLLAHFIESEARKDAAKLLGGAACITLESIEVYETESEK